MTVSARRVISELIVISKCFPSERLSPSWAPKFELGYSKIRSQTACDFPDAVLLLIQENLKAFEPSGQKLESSRSPESHSAIRFGELRWPMSYRRPFFC
jgi:hypothetical protein